MMQTAEELATPAIHDATSGPVLIQPLRVRDDADECWPVLLRTLPRAVRTSSITAWATFGFSAARMLWAER